LSRNLKSFLPILVQAGHSKIKDIHLKSNVCYTMQLIYNITIYLCKKTVVIHWLYVENYSQYIRLKIMSMCFDIKITKEKSWYNRFLAYNRWKLDPIIDLNTFCMN